MDCFVFCSSELTLMYSATLSVLLTPSNGGVCWASSALGIPLALLGDDQLRRLYPERAGELADGGGTALPIAVFQPPNGVVGDARLHFQLAQRQHPQSPQLSQPVHVHLHATQCTNIYIILFFCRRSSYLKVNT